MNKFKETLSSVWKAARYSFAFCLRNNKRDTIIMAVILLTQTLIGYGMILLMGELISTIQASLQDTARGELTIRSFVEGNYYLPILLFVIALFVEIILQKYRSFISSRQRQILRVADHNETNLLKGSLDIARRRSKSFDDLQKKIDELPDGWYTRISFAGELIEFFGAFIGLVIFGISLVKDHPVYVLILIGSSIPMVFAEFIAVSRMWRTSLELIPHHKRRGVLQQPFFGKTSFLQGLMFNQLPILASQIKNNNHFVIRTLDRVRWQNLQITLGAYIVAMGGLSIVLLHCVYNTLSTGGDIGVLTVVIASSRRLQTSIRDIALQLATQWQSVKGVIMIEEEYFGMKPMLETPNPINPEFADTPIIRFNNVCFSYPEHDALVLKNVSFTIEPRSKVVIVGENGSGKSSLIGLLLRHYDPTSGNILVGDINLRNIPSATWHEYASALLQDFVVFERKVGGEIASSRLELDPDMKRIVEASQFAGFDSVIEKDPDGYESQIGTEFGGREFSGGEEQRLALARARYRNTPIFILDEPDARLDPEAANKLMEKVFGLKDTTVIIVTQHISRATKGDKVIVMNQGEVVETGTHEELLSRDGKYASMFKDDKSRYGS